MKKSLTIFLATIIFLSIVIGFVYAIDAKEIKMNILC